MKQILIALLAAWVTCSVVNAQNQTQVNNPNSAVTVIGVDTTAVDTTNAATTYHSQASIVFDDDDFPFNHFEDAVGGGILVAIISIIMIFGFPVFIIFIIFFFRYKNRKARYRIAEQALAAGHPLPENFIKEIKPSDPCAQGIRNTFTGIGLFVFLWGITGEFSIGTIGLLIMFMGLGQWLIGYNQQKKQANTPTPRQDTPLQEPQQPQEPQPIHPSADVNDEIR